MREKDLTAQAMEGYTAGNGAACPYYKSSATGMAWQVGAMLRRTGRTAPRNVRMGRGYHVHANDMLWAFDAHNAITRV